MFVQDFMIVERSSAEVVSLLGSDGRSLLADALGKAGHELDDWRVRVGPESWPALLSKTVEVRMGPARQHGEVTLIAFSWHATGAGSLFPALDGDLEVSPMGTQRCELALRARYDPPGGSVGRGLDRLLLHRLADATARSFLSRLAVNLSKATPPVPLDTAPVDQPPVQA